MLGLENITTLRKVEQQGANTVNNTATISKDNRPNIGQLTLKLCERNGLRVEAL